MSGSTIIHHAAPASDSAGPEAARSATTAAATPRALLVTPVSPWTESSGTQQRTAHLYRALSNLMPVDVLLLEEGDSNSVAPGNRPEILAGLSWKQPPLTLYKYGVHRWVDEWCHSNLDWSRYALVVSRYLTPMTKVEWPAHVRTIVDCDDAIYWYTPQRRAYLGRLTAWLRTWVRYAQTTVALKKFDHAFYCSRRDYRMFPGGGASILPNVVHAPATPSRPDERAGGTALIVGSMWYPPNRDGVDWFLAQCWPGIAARCPGLRLRIVGSVGPMARESWRKSPRTDVMGFVDDLAAEYGGALFVIAPIQYGGGSCIKFLEASAFGKPSVVTQHVYSAFDADFRDGESVAVGGNEKRIVQICVALYEDARRRDGMGARARAVATSLYNVQKFDSAVRDAVKRLLPTVMPGPAEDKAGRD